jgi:hypothetical protein
MKIWYIANERLVYTYRIFGIYLPNFKRHFSKIKRCLGELKQRLGEMKWRFELAKERRNRLK